MSQLTEKDFLDIKDEIKEGRLSPDSIRFYLGVFMFFSALMVGIAFAVAVSSSSVIGWDNLSVFWHSVFWLQAALFLFQLILIFLVRGKSNRTQIILLISYVIYTYKMVLDPFVLMSMFAMNDGVYETFRLIFVTVIIVGFLLHLYLIRRTFIELKVKKSKKNKKEKSGNFMYAFLPILFLLVSITGYIIKNELLGENEILFGTGALTFLYIAVMIGAVEFVMGAYCIIRFPSFRVNPPSSKKKNA